jgi:predicted nucleic acid-binding protein
MYLIDTSVFSFLYRGDPLAVLYAEVAHEEAPLFLSVQTVAELLRGARERGWSGTRTARLRAMIANFTILAIDSITVEHVVEVALVAQKAGRRLAVDEK